MQDMQLAPISGHAQPAHPQAGNTSGKPRGQTSCASPLSARACEDKHRHAQNTGNPPGLCCQKGPDVNQQPEFYKYMKTSSLWF